MTLVDQTAVPKGRPRDPSIDDRIRTATRELLVEVGWDATTIRGIAARAGVSRAALLRRWRSKPALVLDAVLGETPDLSPFEGVDVEGWVRSVTRASNEIFARPEVRAAAPALLAALRDEPELRQALWSTFTTEAVAIYAGQHSSGQDDASVDAKAVIVLAAGAALFGSVLAGDDDTPALRRRIEELLLAGGVSAT